MDKNKKEQLKLLKKLIDSMSKEKALPRDLQVTFIDIKDYIMRNG